MDRFNYGTRLGLYFLYSADGFYSFLLVNIPSSIYVHTHIIVYMYILI